MQALSELRVLDFSRFLPGPYCTLLLADYGADVIRVEQPREVAKHNRLMGLDQLSEAESKRRKAFDQVHRNKRSVLLDFRQPEGLEAIKEMLPHCDVLVQDYRPGVMQRAGLGYDEVKAINPRIIYLSVALCGQTGPNRDVPGHDPISLALAGVLPQFGVTREQPAMADAPVSDVISALHGAVGVLTALQARAKTGQGQHIDLAMADTALSLMMLAHSRFLAEGKLPDQPRWGGNNGVWQTKDGYWVCTTDIEPNYWERWCDAAGRPDMKDRYRNRQSNTPEFEKIFASKTRSEWLEIFRDADTQGVAVLSWEEVLQDPSHQARGNVVEIDHPEYGRILHLGPLVKLSDTPGSIRHPSHLPGQDTVSVLAEFGFDEERIEQLQNWAQKRLNSESRNK